MKFSYLIVVAMSLVMVADIQSGPPRRRARVYEQQFQPMQYVPAQPVQLVSKEPEAGKFCAEALDEVNAERAKRGLQPFQHDPLLSKAAFACAKIRAANFIHGHLSSDFDHLPSGAVATSAGCGALELSWGWGTCCTYDNYTYAGAAWVMGSDGRRYMHLFVR